MKIIVTGSLGHISKPLTEQLISQGHIVTVISSSENRTNEIEALGAKAAIGSLEDAAFVTEPLAVQRRFIVWFPQILRQLTKSLTIKKLRITIKMQLIKTV
jgi:nucleoside-diphosphate-sugar epimerase